MKKFKTFNKFWLYIDKSKINSRGNKMDLKQEIHVITQSKSSRLPLRI
jgi:hypothetical protein